MDRYTGLTKDDVPPVITLRASANRCPDHPEAKSHPGFGYAGGGYGPYNICDECGEVFGKRQAHG